MFAVTWGDHRVGRKAEVGAMRLLTRGDFDGLCCAALLKEAGVMDELAFVHPKDIQDGIVEVRSGDILVNVPYVEGAGMWFDHHVSEAVRLKKENIDVKDCKGAAGKAPSTARVVWRYYGGDKFPKRFEEMMQAVDKMDSAGVTRQEIEHPEGWTLLGFLLDPRTGLGRYDFNRPAMEVLTDMVDWLRTMAVEEILALPDMKERVELYCSHEESFRNMLLEKTRVEGRVAFLDLRGVEEIYVGSRFLIYLLFPDCSSSVHVVWDYSKDNVVCSVGHSVVNRTCKVNVGMLLLEYGGGGHGRVGTCQLYAPTANETIEAIVQCLNQEREDEKGV